MLRTNSPGNVMPPAALSLGRTSAVAGASKRFKFSLCNGKKLGVFQSVFFFLALCMGSWIKKTTPQVP